MKTILCSLLLAVSAAVSVQADIQSPPSSDFGPTRKLGRGFSNLLFAITDWETTIAKVNDEEGSEALAYGVIRGGGRFFERSAVGLYEIVTFPFPTAKGKYTPVLKDEVPWIYSGFEEFPPELGWESRYNYVR